MRIVAENRRRVLEAVNVANQLVNIQLGANNLAFHHLISYFAFMWAYGQLAQALIVRDNFEALIDYSYDEFQRLIRPHCVEIPNSFDNFWVINRILDEGFCIYQLQRQPDNRASGRITFAQQSLWQEHLTQRHLYVYPISHRTIPEINRARAQLNPPLHPIVPDAIANLASINPSRLGLSTPASHYKFYVPLGSEAAALLEEESSSSDELDLKNDRFFS